MMGKWRGLVAAIVLPLLLSYGLLTVFASQVNGGAAEQSPGEQRPVIEQQGERGHVALMGSLVNVTSVADPFVTQELLALARIYPTPQRYLAEAPTDYFPGTPPPDLVVHLYEVTADSADVPDVLAAVQQAATDLEVVAETEQLSWLTYLPEQLLVTGPCQVITEIVKPFPGVVPQAIVEIGAPPGAPCADNIQIWQFIIVDEQPVAAKTAALNKLTEVIVAQPNHFIVGASRDHIAGSPYGPFAPGAESRSPRSQPYSGQGVLVGVYDTVPYTISVGERLTATIQGVPVTVSYPYPLSPDLPIGGRPVSDHGTFVAGAAIALAPDASFHLLKVLNDSAIGSEFGWYQAMAYLVDEMLPISHLLAGGVFNYSFTLEVTPTLMITRTAAVMQAVAAVDHLDIAQMAAAGNESSFTPLPLATAWPARHPAALAITAAIWDDSALSCYANQGEVAIWGGGIARGQGSCRPAGIIAQCVDDSHPQYCITSWATASATEYAYGLGSSYATPQVAGLAAQGIESLVVVGDEWPAPSLVRAYVHNLVTGNPDPNHLEIGVIGNPYAVSIGHALYLPVLMR